MHLYRLATPLSVVAGTCALLLACAADTRPAEYYDTAPATAAPLTRNGDQVPGRVARLAYLSGQVQFAPAGEDAWGTAALNRPLVVGDRLLTGADARVVLELDDASIRIDHGSAFDFLALDQHHVQMELSQGTLNLAVRQLDSTSQYEVDTPTVAFVASAPGSYRIDNDPDGSGSMVTVFAGAGTVYGANGSSYQTVAGNSYRFNDSALASVAVTDLPRADPFDQFCGRRDASYREATRQQQRYVSASMIGGYDLNSYGQWSAVPEYGNVWYPSAVPVGWAPYRYGHWVWIDPWGWTWVDDQPWGFAPFHYGRWVYVSNRWGWLPGPPQMRPLYAPALVAFMGGPGYSVSVQLGGGPVGWFPLGPRDVYVPWFHASRHYFDYVNTSNMRRVYVNQTIINNYYIDYHAGRPPQHDHDHYAYRTLPRAVTVVPRQVFVDARPVRPSVLQRNAAQLVGAEVSTRPDVNPGQASLGLQRVAARITGAPGREPFARPVVVRNPPPPPPVAFAARRDVIVRQNGQPLSRAQMQNLVQQQVPATRRDERLIRVPVRAEANPLPPRAGLPTPPVMRPVPRATELPSARYAHPDSPARLPQVPVLRPAPDAGAAGLPRPPVIRAPVRERVEAAPPQVGGSVWQGAGERIATPPRVPQSLPVPPRAEAPRIVTPQVEPAAPWREAVRPSLPERHSEPPRPLPMPAAPREQVTPWSAPRPLPAPPVREISEPRQNPAPRSEAKPRRPQPIQRQDDGNPRL